MSLKMKYTFVCAVLSVFLLTTGQTVSAAINTSEIEQVCNKAVLNDADLKVIDKFVAEAVRELTETIDFTSISKTRAVILAYRDSRENSASGQYREQFSESAYRELAEAFRQVALVDNEQRRFKVTVNLLIMINELQELRLAKLALNLLDDEKEAVRYWAVRCLTSQFIIDKLNSSNPETLRFALDVIRKFQGLLGSADSHSLGLIASFAANIKISQADDLLLQIADVRMKKYENWTVQQELLDGTILKLLAMKLSSAGSDNTEPARRFVRLYSYVIQRYVKGRDYLNQTQKEQLASVMVEVEKSCVYKITGIAQSVIRRAVEQQDYIALLEEHSRLLGDRTRAGRLLERLKIDYGKDGQGQEITAPPALPNPTLN